MNAVRRWFFLLALNLFILAACIPPQGATVTPGATPAVPATAPALATNGKTKPAPTTLTALPPTATLSPSPAPTHTPTPLPPLTSTPIDTPTIPVIPPTLEPTLTPTRLAPTVVSHTSVPPTTAPPTPCAFTWFVTNPPKECPGQAPIYSQTVAEHFERGVLLWRETPDFYGSKIYAFFTDNKWPYWNPTNDQWRPTMPESDPDIVPPAGFFQPVRGFGIFWRQAYFGPTTGSARDRLGWATDREFSLGPLPMQCRVSPDRSYGCLVAGPDHQVYDIEPNNAWSLWPGTILP